MVTGIWASHQQSPPPEAIIVSGDLVQGVRVGEVDWQAAMNDQYRVANEFLNQITERLLGGDRSKVAIVPGNHDVCWNTSHASMEPVPDNEYPHNLERLLQDRDSGYRWSWRDRRLYRIRDRQLHGERLRFYWDFVEGFYKGFDLPRPIDRTLGYQLFEFFDRKVLVAGFDSIEGNDNFNYSGAIPRGAIARCILGLRDNNRMYDLKIAVWHHSIHGPPNRNDYMEISEVHEMVGLGFQLGLHGHQHVAETGAHRVSVSQVQSMAVVSAGSLCAGSNELPRGVNRQYNLIVIDDDFRRGRVHVREMVEGGQFTRKTNGPFMLGHVDLNWQPSVDAVGRPLRTDADNEWRSVLAAEDALKSGNPKEALRLLAGVDKGVGSHARRIALEAMLACCDWEAIETEFSDPKGTDEAVAAVVALTNNGKLEEATLILRRERSHIEQSIYEDLEGRISAKHWVRRR